MALWVLGSPRPTRGRFTLACWPEEAPFSQTLTFRAAWHRGLERVAQPIAPASASPGAPAGGAWGLAAGGWSRRAAQASCCWETRWLQACALSLPPPVVGSARQIGLGGGADSTGPPPPGSGLRPYCTAAQFGMTTDPLVAPITVNLRSSLGRWIFRPGK